MRHTAYLLCLGIVLSSCAGFKKAKEARIENKAKREVRMAEYAARAEAEERAKEEAKAAAANSSVEAAPVETPQLIQDSLLFQFERRPCFGRCPVYKIMIFESGYTTYQGVNFVDYMGYYYTRLPQTEVALIYTRIAETDFFSLQDKYDNENITDLPSMIFRANAMGQDKRIVARYEIPEVLIDLGKEIDRMFAETEWQPVHR
ncbi:MAG: hypothetical protein HKN45_10245 [Flavobacteriales bacterium]|nr:hypothetical protein [Flavobacteriales bacterium]